MSQEPLTLTKDDIAQQANAKLDEIERIYQRLVIQIQEPCSAVEISHIKDTLSRIKQVRQIVEKRFGKK